MNDSLADPARLAEASATRRGVMALARRLRVERPRHGLSQNKLVVLGHLHRLGPATPGALAAHERLQPQSLTRLLAELEADGLIDRTINLTDRRQAVLAITPAGTEALAEDVRARDAWLARTMAANFTPTERELLVLAARLLERLADADPALPSESAEPGHRHTPTPGTAGVSPAVTSCAAKTAGETPQEWAETCVRVSHERGWAC